MDQSAELPVSNSAYSELVSGPFDEDAVRAAAERAHQQIGGHATIALLFVSCGWQKSLPDLIELVQIHARCPKVIGCSAGGQITTGREDEDAQGFSLLVLRLPQTTLGIFRLQAEESDIGWDQVRRWNKEGCAGWMLLGDPSQIGESAIAQWNENVGKTPTFGGLASGSHRVDDIYIFTEEGIQEVAALAIGFRGGVRLEGLVSQGCRPIGEPYTITKADENLIHQLASKNAYDQLQHTFQNLTESQREIAQGNILIGLAMSEYVEDFHTGDFLVRSILGGDPENGALAVGALPRVGQTLQFQLRDKASASADLDAALNRASQKLEKAPFAAVLFNCGGRGVHLFGEPHHDAGRFEATLGSIPLSGFFCNGEIGTIGEKTYLHGFTASGILLADA